MNRKEYEDEQNDFRGKRPIYSTERTTSYSKRARKNKLEIKKYDTPICCYCGHHKTLINSKFEKCARCKCIIRRFK
jgi:hypothetical protein